MNNIVGLAIFGLGIVLLIVGFNESQTISSEVARIAGDSSQRTVWMLAGGAASVMLGLILAVRSRKG